MVQRLGNRARAALLAWRSRRPQVRIWEDGPLLILPGVLDPVATKVGAWLARTVDAAPGERWVDMGCGTGVVGLAMARRGVEVLSVDIDPTCVRNARANALLRGVPLEARTSDLFTDVPGTWDGVVYNVPFWPGAPRGTFGTAFYAGEDFAAIRQFAVAAPRHARRVLVALSESGPRHAEARLALGPHHLLKRERVASEWLVLCQLGDRA